MTDKPPSNWEPLARAWGIGFGFCMSFLAGGAIGYGIDWYFKTSPTWLLVGLAFGLVAGTIRFIREGRQMGKQESRKQL
jgi:F0F1-type ATP synthase assembly protein I